MNALGAEADASLPTPSTEEWRALERHVRGAIARRVPASELDDVMQDVWLRMHKNLHQLRGPHALLGWVRGIARSAVADHLRMRQRHPLAWRDDDDARVELVDDVDDEAATRMLARALVDFIAALPKAYREALTLTELEGLTQARAAEMLGISLAAMKSRVLRGRERLRAMIDACCEVALDARHRVITCQPRNDVDVGGCCR